MTTPAADRPTPGRPLSDGRPHTGGGPLPDHHPTPAPRARWGLGPRLLAAMGAVLAAAAVTAAVVAVAVGPTLFHGHMAAAGLHDDPAAVGHAEAAFRDAGAVALALALGSALLAAGAASVLVTRRIGRSLTAVGAAAAEVGAGSYDVRVPEAGLGREFDELTDAVTAMAARLAEAERLRARLLADVAHELRTPVATITATLEALEDGVTTPESAADVLRSQAGRLTRLAADLAAVTHAEAGDLRLDRQPCHVGELLEASATTARQAASAAGVTVEVVPPPPDLTVRADRGRLGQVLDNLVANAVRHTPPGGRVTLRAAPPGPGAGARVVLTVQDTGEGIAPEHLAHVTERFYRVDTARDRSRGGSGIGLAISRALVEAHGGTLRLASDGLGPGPPGPGALPAEPSSGVEGVSGSSPA